MELKYDPAADAAYIRLRDGETGRGEDLDPRRRVDYGVDGQPIGIEFLGVSEGMEVGGLPEAEGVRALLEDVLPVFLHAGEERLSSSFITHHAERRGERWAAPAGQDFHIRVAQPGERAVAEQPITSASSTLERPLVGTGH